MLQMTSFLEEKSFLYTKKMSQGFFFVTLSNRYPTCTTIEISDVFLMDKLFQNTVIFLFDRKKSALH